ncbi:MAG: hypothetical protein R3C49_18805 [Planctomycetaceae bacterium]
MFLVRSIRRRLVTGFTVGLALMLAMSAAAIWGLLQHQAALAHLDELVNNSPDKGLLLQKINLIFLPLTDHVNLERRDAILSLRRRYLDAVIVARTEAENFYKRCDQAGDSSANGSGGFVPRRELLHVNMSTVMKRLDELQRLGSEIDSFVNTTSNQRTGHLHWLNLEVMGHIAQVNNLIRSLPSHSNELHLGKPLQQESRSVSSSVTNCADTDRDRTAVLCRNSVFRVSLDFHSTAHNRCRCVQNCKRRHRLSSASCDGME